jgi:hypothetical protein
MIRYTQPAVGLDNGLRIANGLKRKRKGTEAAQAVILFPLNLISLRVQFVPEDDGSST